MTIPAPVPHPPSLVSITPVCEDPKLCLNGHVEINWKSPVGNSALLCPVEGVWLNYTIVELEELVNASTMFFPPGQTSFTIATVMPGTTYTAVISFINEAGEGRNTTGGCLPFHTAGAGVP